MTLATRAFLAKETALLPSLWEAWLAIWYSSSSKPDDLLWARHHKMIFARLVFTRWRIRSCHGRLRHRAWVLIRRCSHLGLRAKSFGLWRLQAYERRLQHLRQDLHTMAPLLQQASGTIDRLKLRLLSMRIYGVCRRRVIDAWQEMACSGILRRG